MSDNHDIYAKHMAGKLAFEIFYHKRLHRIEELCRQDHRSNATAVLKTKPPQNCGIDIESMTATSRSWDNNAITQDIFGGFCTWINALSMPFKAMKPRLQVRKLIKPCLTTQ